jgi:peptidoglycan/xylan/chitin deacetylase (PgdA/CDA1 family)
VNRKIPILLYHRVGERDGSFMDEYTVSPRCFAMQMEWIDRNGWHPVALAELLDGRFRQVKSPALVVTFDDGFASNRIHAWPILERFGFPSSTFLVSDRLGSRNTWDGEGRDNYPLLSAEDIAAADRKLMSFHSHTKSHPDLPGLEPHGVLEELQGSKHTLCTMGLDASFFAYPFGSWNWEVVDAVRNSGYQGACSCLQGLNSARTNPFLLRRVEIRNEDVGWRFRAKVATGRDWTAWPPDRPEWLRHVRFRLRRHLRV